LHCVAEDVAVSSQAPPTATLAEHVGELCPMSVVQKLFSEHSPEEKQLEPSAVGDEHLDEMHFSPLAHMTEESNPVTYIIEQDSPEATLAAQFDVLSQYWAAAQDPQAAVATARPATARSVFSIFIFLKLV